MEETRPNNKIKVECLELLKPRLEVSLEAHNQSLQVGVYLVHLHNLLQIQEEVSLEHHLLDKHKEVGSSVAVKLLGEVEHSEVPVKTNRHKQVAVFLGSQQHQQGLVAASSVDLNLKLKTKVVCLVVEQTQDYSDKALSHKEDCSDNHNPNNKHGELEILCKVEAWVHHSNSLNNSSNQISWICSTISKAYGQLK